MVIILYGNHVFIIQMRIKLGLVKIKENKYIDLKYCKLILHSFKYNYQTYIKVILCFY